jgi:hypothetical protein
MAGRSLASTVREKRSLLEPLARGELEPYHHHVEPAFVSSTDNSLLLHCEPALPPAPAVPTTPSQVIVLVEHWQRKDARDSSLYDAIRAIISI